MQKESPTEAAVFTNGQLRVDYAAGCAYLNNEELHLTPIEYKLLCLLSKNVGKVLTHTFIMQNIWGNSWDNDIASLLNIPVRQHRKSGRRETVCPGLRKPLMRVYSRNVLSKP